MPVKEKDTISEFRVSGVLAKDYVPLVATLFYLEEKSEDTKGLNSFIKNGLGKKPIKITGPLQEVGLIVLEKGSFKLTELGLKTSKALHP